MSTAHARSSDPDTSHQAAASVTDLTQKQTAVFKIFETAAKLSQQFPETVSGYTDEELQAIYKASGASVPKQSESGIRTRRSELAKLGKVVDSGKTRKTSAGRNSIVWQKAPASPSQT